MLDGEQAVLHMKTAVRLLRRDVAEVLLLNMLKLLSDKLGSRMVAILKYSSCTFIKYAICTIVSSIIGCGERESTGQLVLVSNCMPTCILHFSAEAP